MLDEKKQIDLLIRTARITDITLLLPLFCKYRNFYKVEEKQKEAEEFLLDRLNRNESKVFLAMNGQTAVGFTQLYPSFSSISLKSLWILNDLYVDEKFRKLGVGKMLLDAAREFALQTNSKGLTLSTGIENETAQSLYEKYGFIRNDHFYQYFLFF